MKQPELGKKVLELRLAKGLTQGELAEQSNLSLRTIQRIESAEVTPRSYTIKLIFSNLDYQFYNSFYKLSDRSDKSTYKWIIWLEQFYIYVIDLFNLKTNIMRKITILSVLVFAIVLGFTSLTNETFAQSESKVKKIIETNNKNFMTWFNIGDIDSLVELYDENACLTARGCGKTFIKNYYGIESQKYSFVEITVSSVSVSETVAVEKGKWKIQLKSGETIGGEYLSEWKLSNKKWLIVNESSAIGFN